MMPFASFIQDLHLASRRLWRARAFTGAAVLTLALGMAGTTVVFALVQGVLLRPLPVNDQNRLIVAWKEIRSAGSVHYPFGDTEIEAVAEASQLLERAAGVTRNGVRRTVVTEPGVSSYANAAHSRYRTLTTPRQTIYLPAAQFQMTATMLVVRSAASLDLVASLTRDRIGQIDAGVQVMRVAPFTEMTDRPLARPRFNAFLLSAFGLAALLLSTVGLYAVMAAFVRERDREIAVRLAVGATPTRVRHFVLAATARLDGIGAAIGLAGAVVASRFLRGLLYEVEPLDPPTMVSAAMLLMVAVVVASYLPLRRATRVDTMVMLRRQ
jgi:hypothetical protein